MTQIERFTNYVDPNQRETTVSAVLVAHTNLRAVVAQIWNNMVVVVIKFCKNSQIHYTRSQLGL